MHKIKIIALALLLAVSTATLFDAQRATAQIIGFPQCEGVNLLLKPNANSRTGSTSISIPQNQASAVVAAVSFPQFSNCRGFARLFYKWNNNSYPVDLNVSKNYPLFPNGNALVRSHEIVLEIASNQNFSDIYFSQPVTLTVTNPVTPPTNSTVNSQTNNPTNNGTVNGNAGGSINTNVGANFNMNLDGSVGSFWNPLEGSVNSVPQLITALIRILFALIGIVAVVIIIVSGFRMVIASGSQEEITKAKKAITWAIIGLIVSLLSFSIVAIVQRLIQVGAN